MMLEKVPILFLSILIPFSSAVRRPDPHQTTFFFDIVSTGDGPAEGKFKINAYNRNGVGFYDVGGDFKDRVFTPGSYNYTINAHRVRPVARLGFMLIPKDRVNGSGAVQITNLRMTRNLRPKIVRFCPAANIADPIIVPGKEYIFAAENCVSGSVIQQ
jgi:hypothetical protein